MWRAILLKNDEYLESHDASLGPGRTVTKEAAQALVNDRNRLKIPKPPVLGEKTSSRVGGHSQGYWVARWVDDVENEFGPISP